MERERIKIYLCRLALWTVLCVSVPGVCAVLLSGISLPSAGISEHLEHGKKEYSSAVLNSGNSLVRLLRGSRQRNGAQGRIFNTRSDGGEGVSCLEWDIVRECYCSGGGKVLFSCPEEKCFWIDFINSALPVRAGPLSA